LQKKKVEEPKVEEPKVIEPKVEAPKVVEPKTSSTPPLRKVTFQGRFAKELEQLATMGFVDVQKNVSLLQKHRGNVPRVVNELLG